MTQRNVNLLQHTCSLAILIEDTMRSRLPSKSSAHWSRLQHATVTSGMALAEQRSRQPKYLNSREREFYIVPQRLHHSRQKKSDCKTLMSLVLTTPSEK